MGNRIVLLNSLAIMLAIVIPTIVATLAFAWWFRAGNAKAVYRPDFTYSGPIELVVWSIPVLVILFLGGITYLSSYALDPYKPIVSQTPPLQVQVVSLDWKWLFIYPELNIASVNRLVLPAATPVEFHLTSASVMNVFFVPQLGSMIYTMNGMSTQLHLQADAPGYFHGQSSHFSGAGFSDMDFQVEALAPDEFAAFAATTRGAGPALDGPAYEALSQQSENVPPSTYSGVETGLYDQIVALHLPPGPGPEDRPSEAMPMHEEH